MASTHHSRAPAPIEAGDVIARLRKSVWAWIDGDRVLPRDGFSLLATLERVQAGLTGEDAAGAQAGIAAFVGQVQALVEAQMLAAEDGHAPIETAAAMIAWLSTQEGADGCPDAAPAMALIEPEPLPSAVAEPG